MAPAIKTAFSRHLRTLVERKGISGRELARRCKIAQCDISRYLSGLRLPEIGMLYKLARGLEVTIAELLPERLDESNPDGQQENHP